MSVENISSASLDRLVDGELSPTERRELLLRLEDNPDAWRRCALAFLEAQSWGREFTFALAKPPVSPSPSNPQNSSFRRITHWAVLAASLLLAFWLGSKISQQAGQNHMAAIDSAATASHPSSAVKKSEPRNPEDVMTMWVHDANGVPQPLHVPLIDAAAIDEQLGLQFQSSVTPELTQQLKDRGYEVESRKRYAPLWLEQGQPLMLPVEDTRIVPVRRDVL